MVRKALSGWVCLSIAMIGAQVSAQTLDQQYAEFLGGKCGKMNLPRNPDSNDNAVNDDVPIGPNLREYCRGLVPTGGVSTNTITGGGSGASSGRGGDLADVLRKRRGRGEKQQDGDANTDFGSFSGFLSVDLKDEHRDATAFEGGQRSQTGGMLLGADYRFGGKGVFGGAIEISHQSGRYAQQGGDFDGHVGGLVLFGSWLPSEQLFVDFSAAYDRVRNDTSRVTSFKIAFAGGPGSPPPPPGSGIYAISPALAQGDSKATSWRAEVRSGYDFRSGGLTYGPRVGVLDQNTDTDAYTETGATPMTLAFDAQTEESLRSSVGFQGSAATSTRNAVLVWQFNADWMHEFRADQRSIGVRLAEDLRPAPTRFSFLNSAPDRDFFAARIAIVGVLHDGLSVFANAESMFGHTYIDRYGLSVGIRREF
jgi:outer membrane lipase/esterase